MDITRVLRGLAWVITGAVSLAVLVYLALLVINRSDELPSGDVATLRSLLETPLVADADNGYVYALGLAVAADQDPVEQGGKRRAFLARMNPGDTDMRGASLSGERTDFGTERAPAVKSIQRACQQDGNRCADLLVEAPEVLETWLNSETWLLERYGQMLQRRQWQDVVPNSAFAFPSFQLLMDAQELHLLAVWRHARQGDASSVRDRLQQDLQFWRMTLRSSRTLLTRMIAVAAIHRHFRIGNLALRALPVDLQSQAVPEAWRQPITREERGLYLALAGESTFSAGLNRELAQAGLGPALGGSATLDRWSACLFQPQATSNLLAAWLLETARAFDVAELRQMPQVVERYRTMEIPMLQSLMHPYNPIGHILIDVGKPSYVNYAPAAADLEGVRRAALLAATLRTRGITPANAPAAIRASPLTDPYTGAPLQWDAEHASVVFTGLARGERQRRSVPL